MGRSLAILGVPGVLDGSGAADTSFSMTVTTTGAQTLTIDNLAVSALTTVDWGDSSSNDYTGGGTRTHNYAGAGTWTVTIEQPLNVTTLALRDTKATLNSTLARLANLKSLQIINVSGFDSQYIAAMELTSLTISFTAAGTYNFDSAHIAAMKLTSLTISFTVAGTYNFNSTHIAAMELTSLSIYITGAGTYNFNSTHIAAMELTSLTISFTVAGTYNFNSTHIAAMELTLLIISFTVAGTYNFDSAHIAAMELTYLIISFIAAGTYNFNSTHIAAMELTYLSIVMNNPSTTIARADWGGVVVRNVVSPKIHLALDQTEVDAVLLGIYDGFPSRVANAGTLNVAGDGGSANATPSGILQAQCPPTTGKEAAYELVNDSCGVSTNHYAAVTMN